jgi:hypothetical protein
LSVQARLTPQGCDGHPRQTGASHDPQVRLRRRFYGPVGMVGYGGCYVKRWVATPYGLKLRWVNVCY